jgi:hypothetical protein
VVIAPIKSGQDPSILIGTMATSSSRSFTLISSGFLSLSLLLGACGIPEGEDDRSTARQALNPTAVPGQAVRSDADNNGFSDVGVIVTGAYSALYLSDADGNYYFDRGDGRIEGTVSSPAALDQTTLTRCDYRISYRGSFENDAFLDTGWIGNHIKCSGYTPTATYNTLIVHKTDPRYVGDPARAIWTDWELDVDTASGFGNWVRPHHPL